MSPLVSICFCVAHTRQHSGGDPSASAQSAKVILADPNTEVFNHLVKAYQNEPGKYIESHLWVQKCIDRGSVVFTPVVYKNPGGRRAGEEYVGFPLSVYDQPLTIRLESGVRTSPKKMKSTYAAGSPPKSRSRRQGDEQETGYINSCVTW